MNRSRRAYRDVIAEEQVQILDRNHAVVLAIDSTSHASPHRAQLEDQLRVFSPKPLFPRQTRRDELRVIDVSAVVKIDIMEELLQLVLVGGDREQGGVVAELLGGAQRHQRIAELPDDSAPRSTNLFEGDPAIVLLVEILEEIAQTHQIVLPRTPSARLRCSDGTPRRSARPS